MKRLIAVALVLGAVAGASVTHLLMHAGAPTGIRPYHQESSIRVVHTSHGYRIVKAASQGQH
jgi:hypothetical protein